MEDVRFDNRTWSILGSTSNPFYATFNQPTAPIRSLDKLYDSGDSRIFSVAKGSTG